MGTGKKVEDTWSAKHVQLEALEASLTREPVFSEHRHSGVLKLKDKPNEFQISQIRFGISPLWK